MSPADGMDGHGLMGHLIGIPSGIMTGIVMNLGVVNSVSSIIAIINSGMVHFVTIPLVLHVKKVNIFLYFFKQSNYYVPYLLYSLHIFMHVILNLLP